MLRKCFALLAFGAAFLAITIPASASSTQNIAVPAYFDPGALWTQLQAAAPTVGFVVMNPNSGPGTASDPSYVSTVQLSHTKGLKVLGYVYTSYGQRSSIAVHTDIDRYYTWYGVDGIFFDEASTSCTNEPYYAALSTYVKAKSSGAKTIINPGTQTQECYMAAADVVATFEDSYTNYVRSYTAPAWVAKYNASRFWHIVFAAASAQNMQNAVGLSRKRGAGYVFVTSDTNPNPYDTLPQKYWGAELAAVQQ
jgi:hypothetical protein